ncbi:MAG: family 43 glycosylhydrolase [Bacteroidaceae bacterium]|nr:family 43 glycosylhydrolase [Bacteroidaceae bacterium]
MKKAITIYLSFVLLLALCMQGCKQGVSVNNELVPPAGIAVEKVAIDTMNLANPFVIYDNVKDIYYMTGDGGFLWRSSDMHVWEGPFDILRPAKASWIGEDAVVTSPEIHKYKGRYYYMATFTRPDVVIDTIAGRPVYRTACEIFVSDEITGPYEQLTAETPLLVPDYKAVHPTFCEDELNVGYLIYNYAAEQSGNATVQIIRLGKRLDVQIGEPYIMFRASQNVWSSAVDEDGKKSYSPVMQAPFMFDTRGGELGILFDTEIDGESAIGVAYTEKDHGLNGPWHIEPTPLLTGNVGGPMLFKDYDGTLVMALHKDTIVGGVKKSIPQFMKMDSQFDKLKVKGHYKF